MWAVELGEALGVPTVTAINGIHVMKGKPTASAGLISSLVRRAGHKLRVTGDDKTATATIIRADDADFGFEVTWTMQMAKDAGLLANGTWKSYPASMLKSRAITQCARDACQEALNGVQYTPEEMGAHVELDEAGEQVVVHQVTNVAAPAAPPVAVIPDGFEARSSATFRLIAACGGDQNAAAAEWRGAGLPDRDVTVIESRLVDQLILSVAERTAADGHVVVDAEVVDEPAVVVKTQQQFADDFFSDPTDSA